MLWAAWRARHRSRGPLAALLFFGGTLFPALGFINVYPFRYSFVADHFQYLASLGIITLVAAGATLLTGRLGRRWVRVAAVLVISGLACLTWRQSHHYHDRESLWRDTLAKSPACWMAHNNLGKLLLEDERFAEAQAHFRQAIGIRPHHVEALTNLGVVMARTGRPDEAISWFRHALHCKPDFALALNNLGLALNNQGRFTEAIVHLREAIRIDPDYPEAHHNLGLALVATGRHRPAVDHLRAAVEHRPGYANAHRALGQLLAMLGQHAAAASHYRETLRLDPDQADALNNLAWLRATAPDPALRDGAAAVRMAGRAVELGGRDNPGFLDTQAAAFAEAGRWAEAVAAAEEALVLARANGRPDLVAEITPRLALFRSARPYRDEPPPRR